MPRIFRAFLFWTLILCACSPAFPPLSLFHPLAPSRLWLSLQRQSQIPDTIVTLSTPHIDQPPDGNIPTTAAEPAGLRISVGKPGFT